MITCETPGTTWTVEGKIEVVYEGGPWPHVGIKDLSRLLGEHPGRWAKVRVELIEGPNPIEVEADREWVEARGSTVVDELKRMRSLATEVRERMVRAALVPANVTTVEQQCIETLAETMLVVCDQIEAFDRRLQSLEGVK